MWLTRNFKTVMIIQNVTMIEGVIYFLPEGGKVIYFKMHPKVTTVLELSSKIYLKLKILCLLKYQLKKVPDNTRLGMYM